MINYTPQQLDAIHTVDRNLQIIACAGSGKTQVISERIVNIIKNSPDVLPKNIVAFTYTEKAAAELKNRVLRLFKEQLPDMKGLVDMYIGTIHSWCLKILQEHIYQYQKFTVLDDIKLNLFVDRHFNKIGMQELNMERYRDTKLFIQLMSIVRESELTAPEEEIPPNLTQALKNYENTLGNSAYFDFTMIMTKAYQHLMEDEEFRLTLGSKIKYLIVDEYQDVNPIQEYLIKIIADLGANICVVGDDDQTIYQWRGSDIKYIVGFDKRYDNVKQVTLADNFRSTNAIVELATKVIQNNNIRLPKIMNSQGHQSYEQGDLLYNEFANVDEENQHLAGTIMKLRGTEFIDSITADGKKNTRGLDYSDFVILLRKWKKAENLIHTLEQNNIPFVVAGVNELFRQPEILAAIKIFYYLNEQVDKSVVLESWSSLSPKINSNKISDAVKYLDSRKPYKIAFYGEFVLQKIFLEFLEYAGITEEVFQDDGTGMRIGNTNEEIMFYNLGMFSHAIDDFETIHFMDKPKTKLNNFLNFIKYSAAEVYSEGWINSNYKTPNAVQIMTIFQAKGLEFPVVFIPGLNQNYLPSSGRGGRNVWHYLPKELILGQERYEGGIEDERRLLYVGITRSQKYLFISRAPDGKMQGKPSAFVPEIRRSDYIFSNPQRDYAGRTRKTPEPKTGTTSILLNFSVLKNYFDCPYLFKLISMYGFLAPLSVRLGYGRSIHNVMMEIHNKALLGEAPDPGKLPELLDRHVHIPYAVDDIKNEMKEKAHEAVLEYLKLNAQDMDKIEFAEKDIQIDLGDDILINGRIDLIKKKDIDGTQKTTIIDFKSAEDAQTYEVSMEQLSLYAIGYHELSGENADFLQIYNLDKNYPDTKEIQISDLNDMKKKIKKAADCIRTNKLNKTTNAITCTVCRRQMICSGIKG